MPPPAVRTAQEEAMSKARTRQTLAIAPPGSPLSLAGVEWLQARDVQDPGRARLLLPPARRRSPPYANICEQCDNYVTAPEFIPRIQGQLAGITALRDDATQRGWHTEVARRSRVIASLQTHF